MVNENFAKLIRERVENNVRTRSCLSETDISTLGDIAEQVAMEMAKLKDNQYKGENNLAVSGLYEKVSKYGGCIYVSGIELADIHDGQDINIVISKV